MAFTDEGDYATFSTDTLSTVVVVYTNDASEASATPVEITKVHTETEPVTEAQTEVTTEQEKAKENPMLIIVFVLVIAFALLGGIYYSRKNLKSLKREVAYGEQLKAEGEKKAKSNEKN